MGIFKIYSLSKDNEKRYISNTSPLLWTDDKNKAKIFRSEGEIKSDLAEHTNSLEKMINNLELVLVTEQIE